MYPTPPLTDDLRHALSVAMGHPDDWAANEWLEMEVKNVQIADMVSPFVVESIDGYDNDYIECNGYWPDVDVSFDLCGNRVQATMRYQIQGTTDEVTSCDCCGRVRLKHTVALLDTATDQVRYMGVICAAQALKVQADEVRRQAKQADDTKRKETERLRTERNAARAHRWQAYLVERTGGIYDWRRELDIFAMIQALGGYKAARAGFVE